MYNSQASLTWSPGQRVNPKDNIEPAGVASICNSLKTWFLYENPPADDAMVLPDSVRFIDPKFRLIKCSVRTSWWMNEAKKEHVSHIRVKIDNAFRIIPNSLAFT